MHSSTSHSTATSGDIDALIGQMLDGRLRVLRCIGRGGMGTVYVAEHIGLGKQVAVKVLNAPYASQPDVIARLHSEARYAAAIASEHIVDVVDIGQTDSGQPYVVMELLHGESLAERLRRCTALSELDTLHIGRQLASALSAAHRSGIVHRDIKPENIFLCPRDGRDFVKLLDFGISKAVGPTSDSESDPSGPDDSAASPLESQPARPGASEDWLAQASPPGRDRPRGADELLQRLTRTGSIVGTPLYMSPEQARGERLDSRCDIYSLGVVLYECLTGSVPFLGTSYFAVIAKILTEAPDPPSQRIPDRALSPTLEQIVLRAMAHERSDRYQTMEALLADLDRYQRGEPIHDWAIARTSARASSGRAFDLQGTGLVMGWLRRRKERGPLPLLMPLLAGTLVVLLLGGLLVFWRGPQPLAAPPLRAQAASGLAGPQPANRTQAGHLPTRPLRLAPQPSEQAVDARSAAAAPASPARVQGAPTGAVTAQPTPRRNQLPSRPASRSPSRLSPGRTKPVRSALSPPPPAPLPIPLNDEQAPNPFVTHTP